MRLHQPQGAIPTDRIAFLRCGRPSTSKDLDDPRSWASITTHGPLAWHLVEKRIDGGQGFRPVEARVSSCRKRSGSGQREPMLSAEHSTITSWSSRRPPPSDNCRSRARKPGIPCRLHAAVPNMTARLNPGQGPTTVASALVAHHAEDAAVLFVPCHGTVFPRRVRQRRRSTSWLTDRH